LKQIVAIAQQTDAYILCDEVYCGTDQDGDGILASIADLYYKVIATNSSQCNPPRNQPESSVGNLCNRKQMDVLNYVVFTIFIPVSNLKP